LFSLVFFFREQYENVNFEDAVKNGIRLAVKENIPLARLMPLGKLRKFERIFDYRNRVFKGIGWYRYVIFALKK
jgi:hypothetical protein